MEWMTWVHGPPQHNTAASLNPGDEVRVWYRILEQGKERLGQFEGTVIRTRGSGPSKTFSVRRISFGEGVERVFPVDSKTVARIDVLRHGHVKRARLYYLRTKVGKVRIETTAVTAVKAVPAAEASKPADAQLSATAEQAPAASA